MLRIDGQIQRTVACIGRLDISSRELNDIKELLAGLAEQTHVLALNVAIQAVSAGLVGQGLSIIAEQLLRLAANSARAIGQISPVLERMVADTHDARTAMEQSRIDIDAVAVGTDNASNLFLEVLGASQKMTELIAQILTSVGCQRYLINSVAQDVEAIGKPRDSIETRIEQALSLLAALTEQVELLNHSVGCLQGTIASPTVYRMPA